MKRLTKICTLICAISLVVALAIPRASADPSIASNWLGAIVNNTYDSFYESSVTGYEEGTNATLVVSVYNDMYPWYNVTSHVQANVSAVKVNFDWGQNYSSNEASMDTPFVILHHESHVFTIAFSVPNVTDVSNLLTHSYTIYVENVNSTVGAKSVTDLGSFPGSGFAIFSSDQADAILARENLEAYPTTYLPFLTANARELTMESSIARKLADEDYSAGNFASAKTDYQNALRLMQDAYANETDRWESFENAFEGLLTGTQSLVVNQGYAWLLFGIALLLMSIGVIVYLVRKSGKP